MNTYMSLANKYHLKVNINPNPGKGIGYDFDYAISCGMTKLVTIAHQDDIYDYEYSYQIVNKYKKYPTSSIIFSDYYEIRENKKCLFKFKFKNKKNFTKSYKN